jgi:AraC-like DNA-binding protein
MYAYLFFALMFIGVFSFIENIKGGQKISLFKLHILVFLAGLTIKTGIDFLNEIGYNLIIYASIIRLFISIACINIFYLVANHKIPQLVVYIEMAFFILYLIALLNGFEFLAINEGIYNTEITLFIKVNVFFTNTLIAASMVNNIYTIYQNTDPNNLYQVKIKRWAVFLVIFVVFIFISVLILVLLHTSGVMPYQFDTRMITICYRTLFILFIFFRPKFIDEYSFSIIHNHKLIKQKISAENFDFLFYGNHYYLNLDANLEDFALKLNHNKVAVLAFLKTQTNENFNEFLNRNRIKYFKELLKSNKQESFTIEALSEMSGFNNKRTMYNAFKKYDGGAPSTYLATLN